MSNLQKFHKIKNKNHFGSLQVMYMSNIGSYGKMHSISYTVYGNALTDSSLGPHCAYNKAPIPHVINKVPAVPQNPSF